MELLSRKVHIKQLKNNGKIAVSMCLQLLWNKSMKRISWKKRLWNGGNYERYIWIRYIYIDKIRVIDGENEYYYGKTLEKINKMKGYIA